MPERLKLALIGCGAISKVHRIAIAEGASRIDITAAVDIRREYAEAVAAETGAAGAQPAHLDCPIPSSRNSATQASDIRIRHAAPHPCPAATSSR